MHKSVWLICALHLLYFWLGIHQHKTVYLMFAWCFCIQAFIHSACLSMKVLQGCMLCTHETSFMRFVFTWLVHAPICNCTCGWQTLMSGTLLSCTTWACIVLAWLSLCCSSIARCPWRSNKHCEGGVGATSESMIGVKMDNSWSYNETHNNNPL